MVKPYPDLVNSSNEYLENISNSSAKTLTTNGRRFGFMKVFSNVDIASPLYVLVENPADSGKVIELQERFLETFTSGLTNFHILWDYDVSNATKTSITTYNQYKKFIGINDSVVEVSVLNPVTAQDVGDWAVTGSYTPTDEGTEREPDFIGAATGFLASSTGDISPRLGVRAYEPGEGFLVKIVPIEDNERVKLGYDWFEEDE